MICHCLSSAFKHQPIQECFQCVPFTQSAFNIFLADIRYHRYSVETDATFCIASEFASDFACPQKLHSLSLPRFISITRFSLHTSAGLVSRPCAVLCRSAAWCGCICIGSIGAMLPCCQRGWGRHSWAKEGRVELGFLSAARTARESAIDSPLPVYDVSVEAFSLRQLQLGIVMKVCAMRDTSWACYEPCYEPHLFETKTIGLQSSKDRPREGHQFTVSCLCCFYWAIVMAVAVTVGLQIVIKVCLMRHPCTTPALDTDC